MDVFAIKQSLRYHSLTDESYIANLVVYSSLNSIPVDFFRSQHPFFFFTLLPNGLKILQIAFTCLYFALTIDHKLNILHEFGSFYNNDKNILIPLPWFSLPCFLLVLVPVLPKILLNYVKFVFNVFNKF